MEGFITPEFTRPFEKTEFNKNAGIQFNMASHFGILQTLLGPYFSYSKDVNGIYKADITNIKVNGIKLDTGELAKIVDFLY